MVRCQLLGLTPFSIQCSLARHMTLLVALRGKDGIVAAADSRGTFGDPRGVTAQNDSQRGLRASK